MSSKIFQTLTRMFEQNRIIFWYDERRELRAEFEALELPGIEKLEIDNNEFALKYRILRQEPERKFLLYRHGPAPGDLQNWLLDVELAHAVFYADQVAIWLNELELGSEYGELVREHLPFFKAARRREVFRQGIRAKDDPNRLRLVMLAVCCGSEFRLDAALEALLAEMAQGGDEKIRLIERCGLEPYLWKKVEHHYGYRSETPGLKDFVLDLFKYGYEWGVGQTEVARDECLVFLNRWKDNIHHGMAYDKLSQEAAEILQIEDDLRQRDLVILREFDYFSLVDRYVLTHLIKEISARTIALDDCLEIVRRRRRSHWYREFADLYEAVYYAARFLQYFVNLDLEIENAGAAIRKYTGSWFKIDQFYRKFIHHYLQSGQTTLLKGLNRLVENHYTNTYLLEVNNNWQKIVDEMDTWGIAGVSSQQNFFRELVRPVLDRNNRMVVIISDALRYEIGDELVSRVRREDRYGAELAEPRLGVLPSYTQLGMAALLPHRELRLADDGSGTVLVDGQSSTGTDNRAKIIQQQVGTGTALQAETLLAMNRDECRHLIRENQVIYVYHNRIDAAGDKKETEGRVFSAVEETLDELLKVIKKLAAANVSNIMVTTDHGFIYQHQALDESDFAAVEPTAEKFDYRNRRFWLGKGFYNGSSCKIFSSAQLGLAGEQEIALPKSINRLRLQGSGSRFVHGGASLQEIILPVIKINKKRKSDVSQVEVDILQGANTIITSGQITATFYQRQGVTDKIQPRILKAGIFSQQGSGELISDSHELIFDLESENPREREVPVRFILTRKADNLNNQEVVLRLEEKIDGTSHYRTYKSITYKIRRALGTDFDF